MTAATVTFMSDEMFTYTTTDTCRDCDQPTPDTFCDECAAERQADADREAAEWADGEPDMDSMYEFDSQMESIGWGVDEHHCYDSYSEDYGWDIGD